MFIKWLEITETRKCYAKQVLKKVAQSHGIHHQITLHSTGQPPKIALMTVCLLILTPSFDSIKAHGWVTDWVPYSCPDDSFQTAYTSLLFVVFD